MHSLDSHPETGISFATFQLPFWQEVQSLAETAAQNFLPIRIIDWDIALTPKGPVLIEGSFLWKPFNQHPHMGLVAELLRPSCRKKTQSLAWVH